MALHGPENYNNKNQLWWTTCYCFYNKQSLQHFKVGEKGSKSQNTTSAILPVFCWQHCTCPHVWVRLHHHAAAGERKSAAAFCFIFTPAPGYSKLQIAADNIARYWNMFDLLTHTRRSPPMMPPLSLLCLSTATTSFSSSYSKSRAWSSSSDSLGEYEQQMTRLKTV